jgi:hypothetical protein
MKRILLTCAALIIFTATAFAYRVGDIIMVGGEMGVVFVVTTDGQHGKVMSVSRTRCNWEQAKAWCAQYGRGWRLPKKDELKIIYNKKVALNSALTANGYEKIVDDCYWSSEEYNSDIAWYVVMLDGYTLNDLKSSYYNSVRAVSAF